MLAQRLEMPQLDIPVQAQPRKQMKTDARPSRALRFRCLAMVLFLIALGVFVTARSAMIISEGYSLVEMKSQAIKMEKENEVLRLEVARLKSPQRIQAIATSQLGMVVPTNVYCAVNSQVKDSQPMVAQEKEVGLVNGVVNLLKAAKAEASHKN
jgi:cell division protein FtsL